MLFDGDSFELRGYKFRVGFPHDDSHGAPWEEHDGHGIVSNWRRREEGKRPGERLIVSDGRDYGLARYYDITESIKIARRDGWGCKDDRRPGETDRAYAARAVEEDFAFLRGWCNDEWHYVGVVVTLEGGDERESLWGIESNAGEYLETVAHELADEILARVRGRTPRRAAVRELNPFRGKPPVS